MTPRLLRLALAAAMAVSVLCSLPPSFAQAPGRALVLTGARVIDGTGRPPIERATIIVRNGRIETVRAAAAEESTPADSARIDLSDKTIIPGLINAHAHLNVDNGSTLPVRDDLVRRLRTYAEYGVTTAVSLGSTPADEIEGLKLRDEQASGVLDRARLFTGGLNAVGKTPDEARKSVDRLADLKVDVIKFHINGTPNDMTPETWSAIIDEAHRKGLRTAVHIFYLKDAQAAVDRGVDVIAHSVRDQDVPPAFVHDVKSKRVGYIPTLTRDLSVFVYESRPAFFDDPFFLRGIGLYRADVERLSDPKQQEKVRNDRQAQAIKPALAQGMKNLKTLSDAGVTIAMGTDSGAANNPGRWQGYFEHLELESMVRAGMTPMQTLVAATSGSARVMNLEKELGTIEPGKMADLLVLDANPLDDIRNTRRIDSVWIAGRRLGARPQQSGAPAPSASASAPALDFDFFKTRVQPIFQTKRPGHARCISCHIAGTPMRLQPFSPGATTWSDDESRKNFDVVRREVVPGSLQSKLLVHPLAEEAGGDLFHNGGKHWNSQSDPEWQTLAAWVRGEKAR